MITSLTLLILSLVALYIGAGWLVQGSSALALKAKISPLVVGLTIVAFGTSAPELVVSLNATLFWNITSDLQAGAEYLRGWRTDFNGDTRHANRVNLAVQYSF